MSTRSLSVGLLSIKVRYLLIRPEGFYYQRRIPRDLQQHYSSWLIRESLRTSEPQEVIRRLLRINSKHEADWCALRGKGELLTPKIHHKTTVAEGISDEWLGGDLGVDTSEALSDSSGSKFYFSQARELYLLYHPKGGQVDFIKDTNYSCDIFLEVCGDLPIAEITRSHAHDYLEHLLKVRGNKTTSARRRIDKLNAVINKAIREKGLNLRNPFAGLGIPKEGSDAEKREDFTSGELSAIIRGCQSTVTPATLIILMLVNTGARLSEIAGLRVCDVRLDAPIPHISINADERSIKTEVSERYVPLLGVSLEAAESAMSIASGGKWLFPRYASDDGVKGRTVSASCAKWTKKLTQSTKTSHHFRHTLQGKLRAADVPEEIREAILGWGEKKISKGYGKSHPLIILAKYLKKVAL